MSYDFDKIPTCDAPGCEGHLGKFEDCISEAVWSLSLDLPDEQTGETTFFGSHVALIVMAEDHPADYELNTVAVPAGNYLVESIKSGAVFVTSYETEAEARAIFDDIDAKYGAFTNENEELYP